MRLLLDEARRSIGRMSTAGRRCSSPANDGHVDAARLLLEIKARRSIGRMEDGATPLLMACAEGHVAAVRLLLDNGAEVDRAKGRRRDAAVDSPAGGPRRRGAAVAG